MKQLTFRSISTAKLTSITAAVVLSTLLVGNKSQADIYEFYVAESSVSTDSTSLLDYTFDSSLGTATLIGTYNTGLFSNGTANTGALQLSGNGALLSYAGFTTASGTFSSEQPFNLSTKTFGTAATVNTTSTIRSSWTQDGTSYYVAGGSVSPGILVTGNTAQTSITSSTVTSNNSIFYNSSSGNLYYTRNSTGATGVYTPTTNGLGQFTTAKAFAPLTGTGLISGGSGSGTYDGIGFLGSDTLFVADSLNNTLNAFHDASFATTPFANWNLTFSTGITGTNGVPIEQLSVVQTDANDALIFFTTSVGNTTSTGSLSTFNEISYNTTTGFGSINNLGSSSSQFFSGIAVVPEPSTYVLLALSLGLVAWMSIRRKAGQRRS